MTMTKKTKDKNKKEQIYSLTYRPVHNHRGGSHASNAWSSETSGEERSTGGRGRAENWGYADACSPCLSPSGAAAAAMCSGRGNHGGSEGDPTPSSLSPFYETSVVEAEAVHRQRRAWGIARESRGARSWPPPWIKNLRELAFNSTMKIGKIGGLD